LKEFFFFSLKTVSGRSHFVQKDLLLRKVPSIYVEKTIKNIILFKKPPLTLLFLAMLTRGVGRAGLARRDAPRRPTPEPPTPPASLRQC